MDLIGSDGDDLLPKLTDREIKDFKRKYKLPEDCEDSEQYSAESFKWTDTEYTPRELLENFHQNMPFIIMATVGYLGRDEDINAVSSEEIYWVKGIIRLPRVIVANKFNAYFSIPITCKFPVVALRDGSRVGKPTTVKQLLEKDDCNSFIFSDDSKKYVYEGANSGECVEFGKLRVVDKYVERYLLLHSICVGRLCHEAVVIPLYLPTTFAIAVDMATGDHRNFYQTMLKMHYFIRSIPKPVAFPLHIRDCDDIMIFDAKPKQGHYDMLLPDRYATFSRVNEGISKGDNHIYMPLIGNSSKTNLERPLPNLPAAATKRDQSPEKQKRHLGQATKSPPMRELFYGGSRGPETGIGQLIGRGYSIMNVNPKLAVQEIQKVLSSGLIPLKPSVEMADITVGSIPESPSVITEPMKVRSGVVSDNLPRIDATSSFMNELESRQISIMNDVPGDLSLLDCDGVGQCLDLLHLAKHRQRFFEALVDGRLLLDLDVEILQNEFGFSKFEALKLVKFVGGWRPITQKPIDCDEC